MKTRTVIILLAFIIIVIVVGLLVIFNKVGPQGELGPDGEPTSFINRFFPFGDSNTPSGTNIPNTGGTPNQNDPSVADSGLALQQLSLVAISGYGGSTTPKGPIVRYVEKSTGNVHEVVVDPVSTKRITNTTIPRTAESFFNADLTKVIMRYLNEEKEIRTFLGTIAPTGTSSDQIVEIRGTYLQDGVEQVTPIGGGEAFIYGVANNLQEDVYGSRFSDNETKVFTSPFVGFIYQNPSEDIVTATTKPASDTNGYMYTLNSAGFFEKTLGGYKGLTTNTNNDGSRTLAFVNQDNGPTTLVYNKDTNSFQDLGVSILPEKCVWSSQDNTIAYCGISYAFAPNVLAETFPLSLLLFPSLVVISMIEEILPP